MTMSKVYNLILLYGSYLRYLAEKISTFLSTFVAKDLEQDLADLDLDGDQLEVRRKGLKYMDQLVRVTFSQTRFLAH